MAKLTVFKTGSDTVLSVSLVGSGFIGFDGNASRAHESIETLSELCKSDTPRDACRAWVGFNCAKTAENRVFSEISAAR